jgi:hypothetical protein
LSRIVSELCITSCLTGDSHATWQCNYHPHILTSGCCFEHRCEAGPFRRSPRAIDKTRLGKQHALAGQHASRNRARRDRLREEAEKREERWERLLTRIEAVVEISSDAARSHIRFERSRVASSIDQGMRLMISINQFCLSSAKSRVAEPPH